jgi:hypothetical protein
MIGVVLLLFNVDLGRREVFSYTASFSQNTLDAPSIGTPNMRSLQRKDSISFQPHSLLMLEIRSRMYWPSTVFCRLLNHIIGARVTEKSRYQSGIDVSPDHSHDLRQRSNALTLHYHVGQACPQECRFLSSTIKVMPVKAAECPLTDVGVLRVERSFRFGYNLDLNIR